MGTIYASRVLDRSLGGDYSVTDCNPMLAKTEWFYIGGSALEMLEAARLLGMCALSGETGNALDSFCIRSYCCCPWGDTASHNCCEEASS